MAFTPEEVEELRNWLFQLDQHEITDASVTVGPGSTLLVSGLRKLARQLVASPQNLELQSDRELALVTAFEIVGGTVNTHHLLNLARCHIEVASTKRMPDATLTGLREHYPLPLLRQRLGSWCPDCGPNVTVDEDGCCSGCGNGAIGPGADDALRALRFVTEHEDHRAHFINWLRSHPLVEDEDGAPYPPAFFDHVAMWLEDHRDLPEGPEKG